jgi:AcrR family transcriptional regulator
MPRSSGAPSRRTAPNEPIRGNGGLTAPHKPLRGGSTLTGSLNGVDPPDRGAIHDGGQTRGRERVVDIQRARMLAAMFDVVAERGAANASVAHVVARSGVSRRTFYELFTDREDCFLAAFDEAVVHASDRVVEAYERQSGWRARIRASLASLLQFLEDQPAMGRLLMVEVLGAGPKALQRRARVLEQVIAVVDQGRAESKPGKEPPPLAAEGVVGAVFSVIHTRMLVPPPAGDSPTFPSIHAHGMGSRAPREGNSLLGLTGSLMGMIVLPYLGVAAAQKEIDRPAPERDTASRRAVEDPLRDLEMRLTYRTVCVLMAIAALGGRGSGPSNRQVAEAAGVSDQGQMSKLLARLQHLGLIENAGTGSARGEPNAWALTPTGRHVEQAIHGQAERTKD